MNPTTPKSALISPPHHLGSLSQVSATNTNKAPLMVGSGTNHHVHLHHGSAAATAAASGIVLNKDLSAFLPSSVNLIAATVKNSSNQGTINS